MKFSPIKSRKRAADAAAAASGAANASGSVAKPPPAKKARSSEDKGPDKYCHFCQHAKQTMMACSSPGCNHRYCVYCLDLHLQEQATSPGSKQWLCPTCRGSCCCCSEDATCNKAHRHCKAFRYRARRALNAASKRASGPSKLGQHHAPTASKRALAAASASGRPHAAPKAPAATHAPKTRAVEEFKPSDAMLALLELAKERLSEGEETSENEEAEGDVSSADGTSSEGEEASASRHTTPERGMEAAEEHIRPSSRHHTQIQEATEPAAPPAPHAARQGSGSPRLDALLETASGMCAGGAPPQQAPARPAGLGPLEFGVASMQCALGQPLMRMLPAGLPAGEGFRPPPLSSLIDVMRLQQQQRCQG